MDIELRDWECDICGAKGRVPEGVDDPVHNCKPRGIGDVVAKGLSSLGITKERVTRAKQVLTGNDYAECGCKGRQNWLNSLWSFGEDEEDEDDTDIEMKWYSLEEQSSLERSAFASGSLLWTHPSDDTPSLIKSPFFFSEKNFFGNNPEFSYLASYDVDGIFNEDVYPDGKLSNEQYEQVLEGLPPINAVRGTEIKLITGRHPDFQDVTERWFASQGMQLYNLKMYSGNHSESHLHSKFKAAAYGIDSSHVYIESEPVQALDIYNLTQKTVACPTNGVVYTNRLSLIQIQKEVGLVPG